MNASAASPSTSDFQRLTRFLREALSHGSVSLVVVAALLGSARALTFTLTPWIRGDGAPLPTLYRLVPSEVIAACMLIAVLIAEQRVRNGARRLRAYIPAVIAAAAVAGAVAAPLLRAMHDFGIPFNVPFQRSELLGTALYYFSDALARGGLAAFIYANREAFLTSIRQLRAAELARARAERDLANSRLSAMQMMMPPEELIATLKAVRRLYEEEHGAADARLAEFIAHLRTITLALPT